MALPIEDYALIGDTHTAALVGRDGSINWAPFPRFDSGACFAALLGTPDNGRWRVAPRQGKALQRRYLPGTMVLETMFEAPGGKVRVLDFMPVRDGVPNIVRISEGVEGEVEMEVELVMRFDYGRTVPWVRKQDHTLTAIAGPDGIYGNGDDCTGPGPDPGMSAITYDTSGGGNHDTVYCSDAISQALNGLPFEIVDFRQR